MAGCPSCGRSNPDDARFCNACGAELAPASGRQVRKTVTVLFSDLVGSTALGESTDPEALRARMQRYFGDVRAIVERHGGTVEKFVGDAVMAVFGIPVAHEDDALRAVRAASEIRTATAEHGLDARTGVNSGEVVVGGGSESLVTGDAVNVAARLEQAADPRDILIGTETRMLVRDAVRVEAVEPLALKGKSAPVEAYRLLEVISDAEPLARRLEAPMVGRERERQRLWRDYEDAVADRTCRLFTLLGPAGIGKSRLVADFLERVGDSADLLRGRCLSYGEGITYWPLVEMLTPLGIDPEEIVASTPEETRVRFRRLLEARAADAPQVVVVDDLQWAEPVFVDLVEHVADLSRNAPIFLLVVARTELLDKRPGWGGGKLNSTSLLLEPLGESDRELLIDNLLGDASLDGATREHIADASDGNPLFVEEMLAMVRELGADGGEIEVPPTIHALLQARLDALDEPERLVVGHAAVEGEVFHRGSVVALVDDGLRPSLEDHLSSLVRKELIRPERSLIPGEDAFRFRHLLIRDAAYGAMPKELRARLHEQFAVWLERSAGATSFELDEVLGYHLEQAVRMRAELGHDGEAERDLAARAGAKLAAAGHGAVARADNSAAVGLLERAIEYLDEDDPARLEALTDLAGALSRRGQLERAADVLAAAIDGARRNGNERMEARARLAFNSNRMRMDPTATVEDELAQALEIAASLERSGDLGTLARAHAEIGICRFMLGRAGEGEVDLETAAHLARRAGDDEIERNALNSRLRPIAWGPTAAGDGIAFCSALVENEIANAADRAHALQVRALFHAMQGDFDDARRSASQAWAMIEEFGFTLLRGIHSIDVGVAEAIAGDLAAAEALLRRGHERLVEMGDTGVRSTVDALLAEVAFRLGNLDDAAWFADQSRQIASVDDLDSQPRWRGSMALVLASRGELADAERLAREAVMLAEPTDFLSLKAVLHDGLGEVLALGGKPADAEAAVERAISLYEQKGNVVSAGRSREVLARLRPS